MTKFLNHARWVVAGAAALLMAGAAQAALLDRDLDGDTVVDAFYDTDLNITWLRNANVNGPMNWATAVAWADGFSFAGYTDWRLPVSDLCEGFNCTGSEMGHLFYVELGNLANPPGGALANTGGFQGLQANRYWSGTEDASFTGHAWFFDTSSGDQFTSARFHGGCRFNCQLLAFAVRPGDIAAAVPEPETYALMLGGLAGLALTRRRQQR